MLRRFRLFECRWATILLGCLGTLFARSPHPTAIGIRVVSVVAMLGVSLYSGFGITGQLAALQLEIERDVTTLANGIQFAARFDHLYTLTTSLLLLNLGGGLSLIYWEARARIASSSLLGDICSDVEIDAPTYAAGGGALRRMRRHGPLGPLAGARRNPQTIAHTNPRNPQHVVDRLDIALDIRLDLVSRRRYLAHLQCACQSAEQSTADGADHVVQRGRHLLVRFDAIERLDPAVDPEPDRLAETLQVRVSQGAADPFEPQSARMYHVCH